MRGTRAVAQIGGYLRTGREPAPITERDPISGPTCRQIADSERLMSAPVTQCGRAQIIQFWMHRSRWPSSCPYGQGWHYLVMLTSSASRKNDSAVISSASFQAVASGGRSFLM